MNQDDYAPETAGDASEQDADEAADSLVYVEVMDSETSKQDGQDAGHGLVFGIDLFLRFRCRSCFRLCWGDAYGSAAFWTEFVVFGYR